jgi:hypothetical protein
MYDKILAVFAFSLFAIFLAILGIWVEGTQNLSLKIVLIITVLMCAYDFWLDAFSSRKKGNGNGGR